MTVLINSVLEIDGACYRIIHRAGSEFILFPLHQDALALESYPADELEKALKTGRQNMRRIPMRSSDCPHLH